MLVTHARTLGETARLHGSAEPDTGGPATSPCFPEGAPGCAGWGLCGESEAGASFPPHPASLESPVESRTSVVWQLQRGPAKDGGRHGAPARRRPRLCPPPRGLPSQGRHKERESGRTCPEKREASRAEGVTIGLWVAAPWEVCGLSLLGGVQEPPSLALRASVYKSQVRFGVLPRGRLPSLEEGDERRAPWPAARESATPTGA